MKKLVTHNGSFHADDIFAAATLSLVLEKQGETFEIIRTRDEEIIKNADFVFDVGGVYDENANKFDHHQQGGAGKRENGIEYASIGLVWKKFGIELCGDKKIAEEIDRKLITPIDAGDNGINIFENKNKDIGPYLLQYAFFSMRPTWREENLDIDQIFLKAVNIAREILTREIIQINDAVMAHDAVVTAYENSSDKRIIILNKNYPYEHTLSDFMEPLFVIYPRDIDNMWGAKALRVDFNSFKNKKDFPAAWAGLRDEELQKITGVADAVFCHRGLFMAVARSKEGAIKLAQLAVG